MKMNDKKMKALMLFLFVAFAVSGFIGASSGSFLIPIVVWFVFVIVIIRIGIVNAARNKKYFKDLKEEIKKMQEDNEFSNHHADDFEKKDVDIFEEAVENTRYDKCDNDECDSHVNESATKKCPLCATANDGNAKYCKICGEELDKEIF